MVEINQKVEAYYENSRSLIEVSDVPSDFAPDPLEIDGDLLQKDVKNINLDIGSVGDKLSEAGLIEILEIPESDDADGMYDFVKARLAATILSDRQVDDLGITRESGLRIGFMKSEFSKKFVFFRVPENDVCEYFSMQVANENRESAVESIKKNKGNLDVKGDKYVDTGRKIYGLWEDAAKSDDFSTLDKVMEEVYSKEEFLGADLDGVLAVLQISLSQEADRPADNWWLARCAVLKTLEILEKDGNSYKVESVDIARKIVAEIAYKCFYPEMLYKFVVEPLSKVNYGDGVKLLDGTEMAEIKNRVEEYSTQKKTAAV